MVMSYKYALVHEWLTPHASGGSELVVQEILTQFSADLYALIDFESSNPNSYLYGRKIGTSFLQKMPGAHARIQQYLPLFPLAIEQLDLRGYDVILSSSHSVAKGILASPQQIHICYCHTPMRYAWDLTFEYLASNRSGKGPIGWLTRYLLHCIRQWDVISANRVDYFIANSSHTARRIWRCYRRSAEVIYPPVNLDRFPLRAEKENFYLVVARLVSYKHVPLIVRAFNQLQLPLVVIGGGPQLSLVKSLAGPTVNILGRQPDSVVVRYMERARALVYAACEDFGITLVEAQACGTPVIAFGQGGSMETVVSFTSNPLAATGLHFSEQTPESLAAAVKYFEQEVHHRLSPEQAHLNAQRFSQTTFHRRYREFVDTCVNLT
jgi:glycosyltransferase involved in cell wall biosynthesis